MFFAVAIRRSIISPWSVLPLSKDPSMRSVCKGFLCGVGNDGDIYRDKLQLYKNGSLDCSLLDLIGKSDFPPLVCGAAFSYLYGINGFPFDPIQALDMALQHKSHWLCCEVLAFHPSSSNHQEFLNQAAELGSINAMIYLAKNNSTTPQKRIGILRHLITASASSFYRHRRAGMDFATQLKTILLSSDRDKQKAWKILLVKAKQGHLPSAMWVVDGYLKGLLTVPEDELITTLLRIESYAPWNSEYTDLLNSKDLQNASNVAGYYASKQNALAEAVVSYSSIFKPQ